MRTLAGFLALIFCLIALPVAAQAEAPCKSANAVSKSIETIQNDYRAWRGHCVSLRGVKIRNRLYSDRNALLEPLDVYGGSIRHSIVLYGWHRGSATPKAVLAEIIGFVGSCADQNAAVEAEQAKRPDDIIMVGGYCHTSLETFVTPVSIRVISTAPISRLTEADLLEEGRKLVEAPPSLTGRNDHLATARAFAAALANGDQRAFARLTDPEIGPDLDTLGAQPAPAWLRQHLRDAHRAFVKAAAVRQRFADLGRVEDRQEHIFVDREDLEASKAGSGGVSSFTTCWCKTPNCTARWPVIALDVDNDPVRPYLCVPTNDYVIYRKGNAIQAQLISRMGVLAEPDWRSGSAAAHARQ
jgi:hypothetical protein